MKSFRLKWILAVLLVVAAGLGWSVFGRFQDRTGPEGRREGSWLVPVEVAQIQRGPIMLQRAFSGALEATAEFVVAPKVSGRVKRLGVDLADIVKRGQIVAELDNDEYLQAVVQAEAELEVAKANLFEARSALTIATREFRRNEKLRQTGVASESQFDAAKADQLAKQAQLEVAKAQVTKALAALETTKIRLGYTKVTADWSGGDEQRVVAERFIDEGETVSANTPLLAIVELDPITGVIFVTEKDYTRLQRGQPASLKTDAYPGEEFQGRIERIAPVFRQATRQARVELTIDNPRHRLKPGMFIRATVVLDRLTEATIIPEQALTTRDDQTGVFVINEDSQSVAWREVKVGIRENGRLQVQGKGLTGRVVTLGQQMLGDGSRITIPVEQSQPSATHTEANTQ
ncbi:MAG: efflux RND transporter periplasmic adaptor subunit [Deltaproteobacteria bacterium]|nr:MAG: efflux RND transporter periplasmic adaptor subunit [Deltaproteobacteria bacterium]